MRSLLAIAAIVPLTTSSLAQSLPVTSQNGAFVLEALSHRLVLPMPDWLDTGAETALLEELVETRYIANERQVLIELLPAGETQEDWRTLYAARITLEPDRVLSDYRRTTMFGYASTCKPEMTGFFQLGPDEGPDALAPLGFVCGAFLDRLEGYAGLGEVMVMSFKRSEGGVAVVYQEWRGEPFDPADPASWPVPTSAVEQRARQLQDEAELLLAVN